MIDLKLKFEVYSAKIRFIPDSLHIYIYATWSDDNENCDSRNKNSSMQIAKIIRLKKSA